MARSAMKPDRMLFAWLWPGGGYFAERQHARGFRAMGGVLFLYLSGLLIGGLDAVDRKHDGIWFYAQAFNGPIAFATDFARAFEIFFTRFFLRCLNISASVAPLLSASSTSDLVPPRPCFYSDPRSNSPLQAGLGGLDGSSSLYSISLGLTWVTLDS